MSWFRSKSAENDHSSAAFIAESDAPSSSSSSSPSSSSSSGSFPAQASGSRGQTASRSKNRSESEVMTAPLLEGEEGKEEKTPPRLPMAEIGLLNKQAQIRGTVTGITSGILCALLTRNLLRQSANITLVTGITTGSAVGYYSSRSNLDRGMRHLQQHKEIVDRASPSSQARDQEMEALDLRAGSQRQHEGGVAGLYDWQDRSHSTRGDH